MHFFFFFSFSTMVVVNESYSVCCLETEGVPICDALLFNLPVTRNESVCHQCIVAVAVKTLITLRDSQGLGSLRLMYSNRRDRHSFLFLRWVYIKKYMKVSRCAGCPNFSVVVVDVVVGFFHNFNKKNQRV